MQEKKRKRKLLLLLLLVLFIIIAPIYLLFFSMKKKGEPAETAVVTEVKQEEKQTESRPEPKTETKKEEKKEQEKSKPSRVIVQSQSKEKEEATVAKPTIIPSPIPTPAVVKDQYTLDLEAAERRIVAAKNNLAKAEAELNAAKQLKVSLEMLDTKLVNDLQRNADEKVALQNELNQAKQIVLNAETAKQNAEQALEQAIASAKTNPEFMAAYNAAQDAVTRYEDALHDKQSAQSDLDNANTLLETANTVKALKQQELTNAQSELDNLNNSITSKEEEIARLRNEKATSESEKQAIEERIDTLTTDLDTANQQKQQAQQRLEQVQAEMGDNARVLEEARTNVTKAQEAIKAAEDVIKKGALGFYESRNSEIAMKILEMGEKVLLASESEERTRTEEQHKDFTSLGGLHLGEEGSSTSLDNMKKAIEHMKKANELRANDEFNNEANKTALKVTDSLMAMAQVNTMGSMLFTINTGLGHYKGLMKGVTDESGANTGVDQWGENATYISKDTDPAVDLYQPEKEEMIAYMNKHNKTIADLEKPGGIPRRSDEYEFGTIGHYLNASGTSSDPNARQQYDAMGFAVADFDTYSGKEWNRQVAVNVFKQTGDKTRLVTDPTPEDYFNDDEVRQYDKESDYVSVEQYEQDFLTYYNKVKKDLADAIQAKKDAETRLAELEANDGMTPEQCEALREATANLETASNKVTEITESIATANREKDAKVQEALDKQTAIDTATSEKEALSNQVADKQQAVQTATSNLETATQDVNTKQQAVTDKQQALAEKTQAVDTVKAEKDEKVAELTRVEKQVAQEVTAKREAVEQVKQELQTAKESVGDLEAKLVKNEVEKTVIEQQIASNQTNLAKATEDITAKEQAIETAKEKVTEAEDAKQKLIDDHNQKKEASQQ